MSNVSAGLTPSKSRNRDRLVMSGWGFLDPPPGLGSRSGRGRIGGSHGHGGMGGPQISQPVLSPHVCYRPSSPWRLPYVPIPIFLARFAQSRIFERPSVPSTVSPVSLSCFPGVSTCSMSFAFSSHISCVHTPTSTSPSMYSDFHPTKHAYSDFHLSRALQESRVLNNFLRYLQ